MFRVQGYRVRVPPTMSRLPLKVPSPCGQTLLVLACIAHTMFDSGAGVGLGVGLGVAAGVGLGVGAAVAAVQPRETQHPCQPSHANNHPLLLA